MQKLKLFIVKLLIPTEPKAKKKFIKALFPGKHLHSDPYTVICVRETTDEGESKNA